VGSHILEQPVNSLNAMETVCYDNTEGNVWLQIQR